MEFFPIWDKCAWCLLVDVSVSSTRNYQKWITNRTTSEARGESTAVSEKQDGENCVTVAAENIGKRDYLNSRLEPAACAWCATTTLPCSMIRSRQLPKGEPIIGCRNAASSSENVLISKNIIRRNKRKRTDTNQWRWHRWWERWHGLGGHHTAVAEWCPSIPDLGWVIYNI